MFEPQISHKLSKWCYLEIYDDASVFLVKNYPGGARLYLSLTKVEFENLKNVAKDN
jgi:hypothetical protein